MCSDAPDTSGMNAAAIQNAEIGREQLGLAREQYAASQARQAKFDPQYQAIIDQALTSQRTQDQRSADQWGEYTKTFLPAERKLAETAMNYDTAGRRDEAAAGARAGVETQFAAQRQAQQRALGRSGISLSGGRALTLDNASRLTQAKASAGAEAGARRQVEATGMSLVDNVAKTGRGLVSTGLQAAGLALNAGGAAGGAVGQNQSTYNASLTPTLGLYSGATGATGSSGNIYGNIAGIENSSAAGNMAGLAGLGQAAGMMYGSGMFGSSKKLKTRVKREGRRSLADAEDAKVISETPTTDKVTALKNDTWRYRKGLGDDSTHIGPYAEDVQESFGDKVAPGGAMINMPEMAKVNATAIHELAAQMDALEREIEALHA